MSESSGALWAIVLAASESRRLLPAGWRSLLQRTLDQVSTLVPPERTMVVIGRSHEEWPWAQTVDRPGITVLVEPMNRDSGPAVLLALAHVLAKDPSARVAVFPTDHLVTKPDLLLAGVLSAIELHDTIALIGDPADEPDCNPFIFAGPARALWSAARRALPDQTAVFEAYGEAIGSPLEGVGREIAYTWLERASFTRAVLAQTRGLVVIPVEAIPIARSASIVSDATLAV